MESKEIICGRCGQAAFLLRNPVYEGFSKIGDELSCSACGAVFASSAEYEVKQQQVIQVFTEEDRSEEIHVFKEDEYKCMCRYCRYYVVNPFMQWCSAHKKEVQATDSCSRFESIPEKQTPPTELF